MFLFLSQSLFTFCMLLSPFICSIKPLPKIVTISPGGYKGYYLLGVTSYLKEHFDTSSYLFSGASAGAWFSLIMTYRGNHTALLENLNVFSPEFMEQDLKQIQHTVSKTLLEKYTTEDFDLKRLAIGVSHIRPFCVKSKIYTDFRDLKDAVNCCQASSHIPFITGGMIRCYDRRLAFDGGFSIYPYLSIKDSKPVIHICADIWKRETEKHKKWNRAYPFMKNFRTVMEQTTVFSKHKYNMTKLYTDGYSDTAMNHAKLAEIFPRHFLGSYGHGNYNNDPKGGGIVSLPKGR
jgi:hypothetical protein